MADEVEMKNGRASAALIAGGIGAVVMGLLTILADSAHAISKALNWYNPTGALSGKSTLTVVIWVVVWFITDKIWKDRNFDMGRITAISVVLLLLGIFFTFPPFFSLFAAH
jgi:hypothetical protein